tara:strand:- start:80 stop:397 length:318 start_codon:yes stop_codon:yes gene_type:complete
MPFALIPDGFKLQKVTKLQKEAVDKYTSSKNMEAFFEGPASAELVKAVAIVVTPIVLAVLAKRGYDFAEEEVKDIVAATGDLGEDLITNIANTIMDLYKARSPYF